MIFKLPLYLYDIGENMKIIFCKKPGIFYSLKSNDLNEVYIIMLHPSEYLIG